ncbi:kinetochore protein Nuf2 [Prunus yedoensis var. nudiflora]|uniref:Kinetochore protein Nuf2 n=1 Tax=Prunus yedoensis var. nudiflora TaxID=2094558 RepID=A0A314YTF5_PRUYE|nr:kinetochore protein Nuf2 [Prunus yedoensis var. nudiflora]
MSKFEFPKLSRSDIVTILADAQIVAISDRDLVNPNPDFVADLCARILSHIDFLHEEDYEQVEFAALEQLENPDLHVDSARSMKLYNRMKEVVALVDCPKRFTLKDLIRPETDRTEYFLSAILNFCLHRETKMNILTKVVDQVTDIDEQRNRWEDRISQLNAEIADYNEAREKELPLVQEVDAKVKELHQTIAGLNNQQMSLRTSLRKLKEKTGEMEEKISSAEFALVQSVQESANLRSRIVQSPDKLQRALEEKKSVREEAKNFERSAMQSFKEKTDVDEVYTKVSKKLSKHLAQMQAIQEQVNSAKSVDRDFKAVKAKLADDGVLTRSLQAKLVEREGKVEQLNELKKQLEKERDLKFEEASKELNNVKLEVESRRRDMEARQKDVEAAVAEVDSITAKTTSIKESGASHQKQLAHKCERS